ncbi:hypothetical protein BCR37DRAFT_384467 [Protomyces lactucae-debilis]|uniref:RING-type domain-containing protein n=1 Tax=Protomyces lactucae-debilis TaxID=2754530 RepID=A0A1Y2EU35_PROLT|nr:uncharacterized protein BCR37DRAFT_384467 [Protomyces lactucae-debilis]ORY74355.1 hypothetical protein BCR37DRAFT_384467 [Protomyces lactucae-debilis]
MSLLAPNSATLAAESCIICNEPLLIQLDVEDVEEGEPGYIYDDVELPCRHHIHYECAREAYDESDGSVSQCPFCSQPLLIQGKFLVTVRNEGGVTEQFDLGADLQEQQYLAAHPQEALNEALLSMAFSGDLDAVKETLAQGADLDATQAKTGMTALHLCALNNDANIIRFLVEAGADKTVRAGNGMDALQLAISEGSHDAAYALQ